MSQNMSQPLVYPTMEGQQAVPPPAYSQPPPAYSQPGAAPPPYNPNSAYQGEPHKIGGGGEPVYYVPPNQQHQQAQPMVQQQQPQQPQYTYSPHYPPPQQQPQPAFYGQPGAPGGPVPSPYSQPAGMPPSGPVYFSQPPVQQIAYVRTGPQRVQGGAMCGKCRLVYPLPPGAHSWRCKGCNEMNNLQGDQCTIM